jgi:hydroxymethylbilane synthase
LIVPAKEIILASRDSLLALTQTIEAAMRLEMAGFTPRIVSMKTAGDIKLSAPLYAVAGHSGAKEGRAFFTRELDDALLSGRADAAVHSFKDLPTEKVPGIGEPIFFCEESGSDVLLLAADATLSSDGAGLVIGTSSLRRIHQLQLVLPRAHTVTLRGNVITRLEKLLASDNGINAILIASAGLRRLTDFVAVPEQKYAHLLTPWALEHIRRELARLAASTAARARMIELPERYFPTAPGQGVLALQLSAAAEARYAKEVAGVFTEHQQIASRVMQERRIMTELMTGCHAPLGVSALRDNDQRIVACYSRKSTTEPVSFSDSVWFERQPGIDSAAFARELKLPLKTIFWWGFKAPPEQSGLPLQFVPAVEQKPLDVPWSGTLPEAVFVASPRAAEWVSAQEELKKLPLYAAGAETAELIRTLIPGASVAQTAGKGFAAALAALTNQNLQLLWVGSADGEARARKAAEQFPATRFLPVYRNVAVVPQHLDADQGALHVLTSAVAAEACLSWAKAAGRRDLLTCCFGHSAAEVVSAAGLNVYAVSEAPDFTTLIRELKGDPTLLRERWEFKELETYGKKKI